MGIVFKQHGWFKKTSVFLDSSLKKSDLEFLHQYGEMGVNALSSSTPIDSGNTAGSWSYSLTKNQNGAILSWNNSNVNDGVNIAVILQTGHGTGTGGYVQGVDYINPALEPIIKAVLDHFREEG